MNLNNNNKNKEEQQQEDFFSLTLLQSVNVLSILKVSVRSFVHRFLSLFSNVFLA